MRASWIIAALLLASPLLPAAELAGVTFAERERVAGRELRLTGLGLREVSILKVDLYVAALYLEERESDALAILDSGRAFRVALHFVQEIDAATLAKAWRTGFERNGADVERLAGEIERLADSMRDLASGEAMLFSYDPGRGVEVAIAGDVVATIAGAEFARALLSVWLGARPPNSELKEGLLGRS